jgi:hypothetical protein
MGRVSDDLVPHESATLLLVAERTLLQRIHNPKSRSCGCDTDCWCRRTTIGRAVKWWFPARWFGIRHTIRFFDGMTADEIRAWKRAQAQPRRSA